MVNFNWFFNNTEHKEVLEDSRFTSDGLISTLDFSPTNNQDYGTLFCQGENVIGHQIEPCAFQIVPTGILNRPKLCSDPILVTVWQIFHSQSLADKLSHFKLESTLARKINDKVK